MNITKPAHEMTPDELEHAINIQHEFLNNVGAEIDPVIFQLRGVELLRALDELVEEIHDQNAYFDQDNPGVSL